MTAPRPPMSQAASEEALRAVTIGELAVLGGPVTLVDYDPGRAQAYQRTIRQAIPEIHFPAKKTSLTPETVLKAQESHADVAFTFDFPIPYGLDPIEAFRRQDLTISCALWAMSARKRTDLPLYACVQGWNKQSYRQCANALKGKDFAGFAVGGLRRQAPSSAFPSGAGGLRVG